MTPYSRPRRLEAGFGPETATSLSTTCATFFSLLLFVGSILFAPGCDSGKATGVQSAAELPERMTDEQLRDLIDEVLQYTANHRRLNLKDHAAWQVIHGALAFGRDFR
ncbi:MAG: hypothetical protein ACKPEY_20955, partial [Planctomycetota bacterium]